MDTTVKAEFDSRSDSPGAPEESEPSSLCDGALTSVTSAARTASNS